MIYPKEKDPGFKVEKIITIRDSHLDARDESTFFKKKYTFTEDTKRDHGGVYGLTLMTDGRLATISDERLSLIIN